MKYEVWGKKSFIPDSADPTKRLPKSSPEKNMFLDWIPIGLKAWASFRGTPFCCFCTFEHLLSDWLSCFEHLSTRSLFRDAGFLCFDQTKVPCRTCWTSWPRRAARCSTSPMFLNPVQAPWAMKEVGACLCLKNRKLHIYCRSITMMMNRHCITFETLFCVLERCD